MWWVNTEGKNWPRAPRTSFAARGAGSGIVWVDPKNDLVFVLRWFDWSKGDDILHDLVQGDQAAGRTVHDVEFLNDTTLVRSSNQTNLHYSVGGLGFGGSTLSSACREQGRPG